MFFTQDHLTCHIPTTEGVLVSDPSLGAACRDPCFWVTGLADSKFPFVSQAGVNGFFLQPLRHLRAVLQVLSRQLGGPTSCLCMVSAH